MFLDFPKENASHLPPWYDFKAISIIYFGGFGILSLIKNFLNIFADKEAMSFYKSELSESALSVTNKMREHALKNSELSIDAGDWFAAQTNKINKLKDIEDYLAQRVMSAAEEIQNAAQASYVLR